MTIIKFRCPRCDGGTFKVYVTKNKIEFVCMKKGRFTGKICSRMTELHLDEDIMKQIRG